MAELTSASGKEGGVRIHLAGLQPLSSTWEETDTQGSCSPRLWGGDEDAPVPPWPAEHQAQLTCYSPRAATLFYNIRTLV